MCECELIWGVNPQLSLSYPNGLIITASAILNYLPEIRSSYINYGLGLLLIVCKLIVMYEFCFINPDTFHDFRMYLLSFIPNLLFNVVSLFLLFPASSVSQSLNFTVFLTSRQCSSYYLGHRNNLSDPKRRATWFSRKPPPE